MLQISQEEKRAMFLTAIAVLFSIVAALALTGGVQ
jgi:hypothetical protein